MADTPPSRVRGATQPPRAASRPTVTKLSDNIAQQLTFAGMMVGAADPVGGFILLTNAEPFGEAWAEVAAVNPRVRAILESWFSKSVYANAGAASLAVLLPLLTHYKLLPRAWFNPAVGAIERMEAAVNPEDGSPGLSLADLLAADKAARDQAADMARMMRDMMDAQNGEAPEEAADHYEAPTA